MTPARVIVLTVGLILVPPAVDGAIAPRPALADGGVSVDEEIAAWSKRIASNPDDVQARRRRGRLFIASRRYELAHADFARLLALDPLDEDAWVHRGVASYLGGDVRAGIGDLERGIALDAKHPAAFFYRGEIERARGDWEAARADFDRAVELGANALALVRRAEASSRLGQDEAASADYDNALVVGEDKRPLVEAVLGRAEHLWKLGERERALDDAWTAVEVYRRDPRPRVLVGKLRRENGEPLEAEANFSIALRLIDKALDRPHLATSGRVELLLLKAEVHRHRRREERALDAVDAALDLSPKAPEALRVRAQVLDDLGDEADAASTRAFWREVLAIEGKDAPPAPTETPAVREPDDRD